MILYTLVSFVGVLAFILGTGFAMVLIVRGLSWVQNRAEERRGRWYEPSGGTRYIR